MISPFRGEASNAKARQNKTSRSVSSKTKVFSSLWKRRTSVYQFASFASVLQLSADRRFASHVRSTDGSAHFSTSLRSLREFPDTAPRRTLPAAPVATLRAFPRVHSQSLALVQNRRVSRWSLSPSSRTRRARCPRANRRNLPRKRTQSAPRRRSSRVAAATPASP